MEGSKDTYLMSALKPLALGSAFNSSVEPDVEATPSRSNSTRRKSTASMEIFGGTEPELESGSGESSDDEEALLMTPSAFVLNKPRRLSAGTASQRNDDGQRCSSSDDTTDGDVPVEICGQVVDGTAADPSTVDDMDRNASTEVEEERLEETPSTNLITAVEREEVQVIHSAEDIERESLISSKNLDDSNFGSQTRTLSKRRNPTEANNGPKRILRKDGKMDVLVPSQKKEVLRLLADQQANSVTRELEARRSKRSSSQK